MIDVSPVIRRDGQAIYMVLNGYIAFLIPRRVKKRMVHIIFLSAMVMIVILRANGLDIVSTTTFF